MSKNKEDKKYFFWTIGVLFIWLVCVSFILHNYIGPKETIVVKEPEVEILEVEVVRFATEKENIERKQEEIDAICKTVWGEARGCSKTKQAAVVLCILNRVEDERFPNDIIGVLTQDNQFEGYNELYPVDGEIYVLVNDVMNRWYIEDEALGSVGRVLPKEYCWFIGNGAENIFKDAYSGDYNILDWALESPYKE